jgi:hypothetical protein
MTTTLMNIYDFLIEIYTAFLSVLSNIDMLNIVIGHGYTYAELISTIIFLFVLFYVVFFPIYAIYRITKKLLGGIL